MVVSVFPLHLEMDVKDSALPDMDALFGKACGPQDVTPKPHPALVQVVEAELLSEKLPFKKTLIDSFSSSSIGEDLRLAVSAMKRRRWADCSMSAASARIQLVDDKRRSLEQEEEHAKALVLAELLLALCAAADGDAVTAIRHADYAFLSAPPGHARHGAVLFDQCLGMGPAHLLPLSQSVQNAALGVPVQSLPYSESVQRFHVVDVKHLDQLVRVHQPFVVRDWQGEAWAARERWTSLAYFHNVAGHRTVPVDVIDCKQHNSRNRYTMSLYLREFLQDYLAPSCMQCESSQSPFRLDMVACLNEHDLLDQCPELRADVPISEKWRQVLGRPERMSVWLGTHGASVDLCCHEKDICITQVQGVREVAVFPPNAIQENSDVFAKALLEQRFPNGTLHSVVEGAKLMELSSDSILASAQISRMTAGDVLFIPSGWWYQVYAISPACSVTSWFL